MICPPVHSIKLYRKLIAVITLIGSTDDAIGSILLCTNPFASLKYPFNKMIFDHITVTGNTIYTVKYKLISPALS